MIGGSPEKLLTLNINRIVMAHEGYVLRPVAEKQIQPTMILGAR